MSSQLLPTTLDAATRLLGADGGSAFWAAHQIELAALLAIPAAIAAISIGQFVRHLITWWDGVVRLHHRMEEIRHEPGMPQVRKG